MGRFRTNAEETESYFERIVYHLHAERVWPDRDFMPEAESMALRYQIIDEIEGMDEIPKSHFVYQGNPDLEVGDSPLVVAPGKRPMVNGIGGGWKLNLKNARIAKSVSAKTTCCAPTESSPRL